VAKERRLPSSKGFDFFVESSFVELYNETCRDLYSKSGPAGAPNLPVSAGPEALRAYYLSTRQSCRMVHGRRRVLGKQRNQHSDDRRLITAGCYDSGPNSLSTGKGSHSGCGQ
jgi:hypothetical protein